MVHIDMSRMAATAIDAAIDDGKLHRRRVSGLRAMIAGGALAGAARVAIKRAPGLPRMPGLAGVGDRIRDRLAESEWLGAGQDVVDDDELVDDDEPVDEGDDEPVDEGNEEPMDETQDEPVDEPEDEAVDESDEEPQDEDDNHGAPVEVTGNGHHGVDPAALPPEPPARASRGKAKPKSKAKVGAR